MEIKPAYLFALPPQGAAEKWCCREMQRITGLPSRSVHWGMLLMKDGRGWTCVESIYKGPAITRFAYPMAYIYRIKKLGFLISNYDMVSVASEYGDLPYDWVGNFDMSAWLLARHYLRINLPVRKSTVRFNCVELVNAMAYDLVERLTGDKHGSLVPPDVYPLPVYLENSPELEYLGEWSK